MNNHSKTLVTLLLTGSMLLGTAGIASAADTTVAATAASKQPIKITLPEHQQYRQLIPYRYVQASISRSQVEDVLNRLVTKKTITKYQARDILKGIPKYSSVTRFQLSTRLHRLVNNGTIKKAQMDAILKKIPNKYIRVQVVNKIYNPIPHNYPVNKDQVTQPNNAPKDTPSTQQEQ